MKGEGRRKELLRATRNVARNVQKKKNEEEEEEEEEEEDKTLTHTSSVACKQWVSWAGFNRPL